MPSADLGRSDRGARSAPTRAVQPAIIRMPQAKDPKPTDGGFGAANKNATHLIAVLRLIGAFPLQARQQALFRSTRKKRGPTFRLFQAGFPVTPKIMH